MGVDPSNVQLTQLKQDKDRKKKIQAKKAGRSGGSAMEVDGGGQVDEMD